MKHVKGKLQRDKTVIEAVIRRFGPASRERVHDITHIRRSTISLVVRELLEEGRLLEAGRINSSGPTGRRQVLLSLNEKYRYVAAIEFDEENVQAGILDLHPSVCRTMTEPAHVQNGTEGLIKQLISCTRRLLQSSGLKREALLGIGIADPGLVDSRRGVTAMSSTLDFWREVPLKSLLEEQFGVPVMVEAKTRAKTVAERMLGAGEMCGSMIYVDYGVGIGAGILVDGKLLYGHNCGAGEFGHTHVIEDGPACQCGSFGCLEAVAGARALEASFRQAIAEGGTSDAAKLAAADDGVVSAWTILKAAAQGDKISSNIVAEISAYLGLGVANLVNLFNPAAIVLDRRLALAGQELLDRVRRIVKRQALTYSTQNCDVHYASLGNEAGLLGVALLILEEHYAIPMLKPPRFMIEPLEVRPSGPVPLSEAMAANGGGDGAGSISQKHGRTTQHARAARSRR